MIDKYLINKTIENLNKGKDSGFLDPLEASMVKSALNKKHIKYNEFMCFNDAEKIIIYKEKIPNVYLYEIKSYHPLEHRKIMGSLFAKSIDKHFYGDIIITDTAYIYLTKEGKTLLDYDFDYVGKEKVTLIERELNLLSSYKREYSEVLVKVESTRIDLVCSKTIHKSRQQIKEMIDDESVILNYEIVKNNSKSIKENDIFSIRKYGKYKCSDIKYNEKNKHYYISLLKYS